MSLAAAIVPFGPRGFTARGRRFLGVFACLQCSEFMRVDADKRDVLNFYCDGTLHEAKCPLQLKGVAGTITAGTAADLHRFADEVRAMRPEIRAALASSWGITITELETIAHGTEPQEVSTPARQRVSPQPLTEPRRPLPAQDDSRPAEPAGKPGNPAGTTGNPEPAAPAITDARAAPGPAISGDSAQSCDGVEQRRHWTSRYFGR